MHLLLVVMMFPMLVWAESESNADCDLTSISIAIQHEKCQCVTINTMSCAGLCNNRDRTYPTLKPFIQKTCNFKEWTYETVQLTGCPSGVDSTFTFPVALSCECSRCNTNTTDCSDLSLQPNTCHTPY